MTYDGDECLWSWQRLMDKTCNTAIQIELDSYIQSYYEITEHYVRCAGKTISSGWISSDEPVFCLN